MKPILQFAFALLSTGLCAQINSYKSLELNWDTVPIMKSEVLDQYKSNSAVLQFEKQKIEVDMSSVVWLTRFYRITFNTEEGVKAYSRFFVPVSNDFYNDYYYDGLDKMGKINRPLFDEHEILLCAARRINSVKSYQPVELVLRQVIEKRHNEYNYLPTVGIILAKNNSVVWSQNTGYNKLTSYYFEIPEAKVGETYEVMYQVKMPLLVYLKNASSRILFNGMLPKQSYELSISYPYSSYFISLINKNISGKPDSLRSKNKHETITHIYRQKNLCGLETEKNCRPYTELPHVYMYMNARDNIKYDATGKMVVTNYEWRNVLYNSTYKIRNSSFNSQGKDFLSMDFIKPYNKNYTAPYEEIFIEKQALSHYITFTDKHNLAVTKFYNRICDSIPENTDVSGHKRISKFHNLINRDFYFYTCNERYAKDENIFSVGELAEKGKLFENGRYRLYADLLYRTKVNFYRNRMIDKRYETIDLNNYYPLNACSDFFTIINDKAIESFMPKQNAFGYCIDEYPFYFENNNSVVTPYRIVDTSFTLPPSLAKTRVSGFSNNIRIHTISVEVDLEKKKCTFKGNLLLSGQFSTLTRSIYTHKMVSDSSINRDYYTQVTDHLKGISNKQATIKSMEETFPYKCNVELTFNYDQFISGSAGNYTLDFKGLINHVIEKFGPQTRNTDYYADFLMHDIYRYTITFSKNVEILNPEKVKKEPIVKGFGTYFTKLSQPGPQQVFMESNFKIISEKTSPVNFNEVLDFYKQVNDANMLNIQIAEK